VRDHRGRLEVDRVESGSLRVSGLQSEQFRLNTRDGRIVLSNLCFRRGHGEVHSDEGDVGDRAELEWVFDMRESGRKLFLCSLWIGAAFLFGWELLGWILICGWGIWAAWEFIEIALPHSPFGRRRRCR
jgi:hypothetical protein